MKSDEEHVKCRVPQGSILLFLLYIIDLTSVSTTDLPVLFADDTNILSDKNLHSIIMTLD